VTGRDLPEELPLSLTPFQALNMTGPAAPRRMPAMSAKVPADKEVSHILRSSHSDVIPAPSRGSPRPWKPCRVSAKPTSLLVGNLTGLIVNH
jgi:hypothetical protein